MNLPIPMVPRPQLRLLFFKWLIPASVLSAAFLTMAALKGTPWGYVKDGDTVFIQDFAIIVNYAADFWQGHNPRPYSLEGHLGFIHRWAGKNADQTMPLGYSPTMLLVLLPLSWLGAAKAYFIWATLPFFLLLWKSRKEREFHLFLTVLLSMAGLASISLGQTSPWAALAVLVLLTTMLKSEKETLATVLLTGVVVFLSTSKPPVAIALLSLILLERRWKTLFFVAGLVLLEVSAFSLYLGPGWIMDYFKLLSSYSRDIAPAALATTLNPDTMSNFSMALHFVTDFSWSKSARISNSLWLCGSIGAVIWAWLSVKIPRLPRLKMAFCLIWGFYLLFVSHLSASEDILILIPIWLLRNTSPVKWTVLLVLAWISLNIGVNRPILPTQEGTLLVFTLKGLILTLCLKWIREEDSAPDVRFIGTSPVTSCGTS